jgi:hypothetical protein
MAPAADARCVIPLRTAEKKHGIKRRPQADARCLLVVRRAVGALIAELTGCSAPAISQFGFSELGL